MTFPNAAKQLISLMEKATLTAANYLLEQLSKPESVQVWRKADNSLVMNLDLEAEKVIRQVLSDDLPVICEEDVTSHAQLSSCKSFFLVDPIDGTSSCKRFLKQQGGQLGFGPLLGLVWKDKLVASCFYNIPLRSLYTATLGEGCYVATTPVRSEKVQEQKERSRLSVPDMQDLSQSGVLFYPGEGGELDLIARLRKKGAIENAYRFGGFANDCTRLAHGYEQVQVQFSVKAWDYSALLFAIEAGFKVVVDPRGARVYFEKWRIQANNPVIVALPGLIEGVMEFTYNVS